MSLFTTNNPRYEGSVYLDNGSIRVNPISQGILEIEWMSNSLKIRDNSEFQSLIQNRDVLIYIEFHCPSSGYRIYVKYALLKLAVPVEKLIGTFTIKAVGIADKDISVTYRNGSKNIFRKRQRVLETDVDSAYSNEVDITPAKNGQPPFNFSYNPEYGLDKNEYEIDYRTGPTILVKIGSEDFKNGVDNMIENHRKTQVDQIDVNHMVIMECFLAPILTDIIIRVALEKDTYLGNSELYRWIKSLKRLGLLEEELINGVKDNWVDSPHESLKLIRYTINNVLYLEPKYWLGVMAFNSLNNLQRNED